MPRFLSRTYWDGRAGRTILPVRFIFPVSSADEFSTVVALTGRTRAAKPVTVQAGEGGRRVCR
jgi:hypothetical protein